MMGTFRGAFPGDRALEHPSRRAVLFSLASLISAARPLFAQQGTVFSADVKVVNVFATVRNGKGEIVRDLVRGDFNLEEDGRPQAIRYFSQETSLPLTIGLLIDTSGSQRNVLEQERVASYRFLKQVMREDKDMAFVIQFEGEVELLQDLTSSRQRLEAALTQLSNPGRPQWNRRGAPPARNRRTGGTALYDAVLLASDELMKKQTGRKALIVLSDGVDTASRVPLAEAIESAQRSDTLAYSIHFAGESYGGAFFPGGRRGGRARRLPSRRDGKKILERVSKETGGGFFEVSRKQSIERIFTRIEEELRNQYSLGYTPDRPDAPGFRRISLSTRQKGLVVQTREGYYAER